VSVIVLPSSASVRTVFWFTVLLLQFIS
jgi:hypothetical protein